MAIRVFGRNGEKSLRVPGLGDGGVGKPESRIASDSAVKVSGVRSMAIMASRPPFEQPTK